MPTHPAPGGLLGEPAPAFEPTPNFPSTREELPPVVYVGGSERLVLGGRVLTVDQTAVVRRLHRLMERWDMDWRDL